MPSQRQIGFAQGLFGMMGHLSIRVPARVMRPHPLTFPVSSTEAQEHAQNIIFTWVTYYLFLVSIVNL